MDESRSIRVNQVARPQVTCKIRELLIGTEIKETQEYPTRSPPKRLRRRVVARRAAVSSKSPETDLPLMTSNSLAAYYAPQEAWRSPITAKEETK